MASKKDIRAGGNMIVSGVKHRNDNKPVQDTDQTAHNDSTATEPEQTVISPARDEKAQKRTKRETHKVYSFWAPKEEITVWNCYQSAATALPKREDLGLTAIREYIERHPLTNEERIIYDALLKREGLAE